MKFKLTNYQGFSLQSFVYSRLIVLTAATLLPFFWMVVILGHRRQRNFERIFFSLCLMLVFFFGASLLALNAELYYPEIPHPLERFSWIVVCAGLWMVPSLLVHLHVEYAQVRELVQSRAHRLWIAAAYLPVVVLMPRLYFAARIRTGFDFLFPSNVLGRVFQVWMVLALAISALWQRKFESVAPDKEQKSFHKELEISFGLVALLVLAVHVFLWNSPEHRRFVEPWASYLLLFAVAPLVALLRNVQKFNFLQIGRQRNLLYAVFAAFIALLYLSLIRRVSLWLYPYFPPEATAALLLFLPVFFFEPLQRLVGRLLLRTAQMEMDQANRTMGPIQEVARLGNLEELVSFTQKRIGEQLQLAEVELRFGRESRLEREIKVGEESFPIRKSGETIGVLRVKPYGAMISGETRAALEYLCEQLPGALDLCRLIEEKLRLERELAERERLAVLGQMAASISHNLKNPLGSIKTILQVQMENPELPDGLRGETRMVLDEIRRLSTKLNQLLQFSRPTILDGADGATCDVRAVLDDVAGVLHHEAERRGIDFHVQARNGAIDVAMNSEAVHDILSNLILNALEATPRGGFVRIQMGASDGMCEIVLDDNGSGIPKELQQKILEPFFTTKTQGTGLGLSIAARRVTEAGGKLEFISPREDGRGTRCVVRLKEVMK